MLIQEGSYAKYLVTGLLKTQAVEMEQVSGTLCCAMCYPNPECRWVGKETQIREETPLPEGTQNMWAVNVY